MNQITKESLDFMNEAREVFEKNLDLTTYRDDNEEFIALRSGLFDDCMMIYELGSQVGNFVNQLPKQHKVSVEYDELETLKKDKKKVDIARHMFKFIFSNSDDINVRSYCSSALIELNK